METPKKKKTWAQFNTEYALAHPNASFNDFATTWQTYVEEEKAKPKQRKPRKKKETTK